MRLTALEEDVILNGIGNNEFLDGDDSSVWSDSVAEACKVCKKEQLSGVVASLVKKGLVATPRGPGTMALTADGVRTLAGLRRKPKPTTGMGRRSGASKAARRVLPIGRKECWLCHSDTEALVTARLPIPGTLHGTELGWICKDQQACRARQRQRAEAEEKKAREASEREEQKKRDAWASRPLSLVEKNPYEDRTMELARGAVRAYVHALQEGRNEDADKVAEYIKSQPEEIKVAARKLLHAHRTTDKGALVYARKK